MVQCGHRVLHARLDLNATVGRLVALGTALSIPHLANPDTTLQWERKIANPVKQVSIVQELQFQISLCMIPTPVLKGISARLEQRHIVYNVKQELIVLQDLVNLLAALQVHTSLPLDSPLASLARLAFTVLKEPQI